MAKVRAYLSAEGKDADNALAELLNETNDPVLMQRGARGGCLELTVDLTPEQLATLKRKLEAQSDGQGGVALREMGLPPDPRLIEDAFRPMAEIDPAQSDAKGKYRGLLAEAVRYERRFRHFQRLRWLFSLRVRLSPLALAIAKSGERYYSSRDQDRRRGIPEDLLTLAWPLIAIVFSLVTMRVLHLAGFPAAVMVAVPCGFFLSSFGAQPCAYVLGTLPCTAGAIPMGLSFSLALAVVFTRVPQKIWQAALSAGAIRDNPFNAVTGGVVGMTARAWLGNIPLWIIVPLIAAMWLSIWISAWLMAQPRRASPIFRPIVEPPLPGKTKWLPITPREDEETGLWRIIVGVFIGAFVGGSGIGLIKLATASIGGPKPVIFAGAFGLIGGLFSGGVVYHRTGSPAMSLRFAGIHLTLSLILCWVAFAAAGSDAGYMALSALCGIYHSTWFTASYVTGEWLGGPEYSETVAVWAAILESAGFVVFLTIGLLNH